MAIVNQSDSVIQLSDTDSETDVHQDLLVTEANVRKAED